MITDIMMGEFTKLTLTNGDAQIISMKYAPLPATIWVIPDSGCTIEVSISFDGGSNYIAWPYGGVTEAKYDTLYSGCTHILFQRTAGSATGSTCGVC